MKNIIILSSAETFFIVLGWLAWMFNPSATITIAIGWGVAVGVSIPYLYRQIREVLFLEKHKKEILEQIARAMSTKLGREVTPEEIEDFRPE